MTHLVLEDPIGLEDYRVNIPPQTDETLYRTELANTDAVKIRAFYAHYFANPQPEIYEPLAEIQIRVTLSGEYPRWANIPRFIGLPRLKPTVASGRSVAGRLSLWKGLCQ